MAKEQVHTPDQDAAAHGTVKGYDEKTVGNEDKDVPQADGYMEKRQPDQNAEEQNAAGLGHYFRVFSFCDKLSASLYMLAIAASVASGAALPLMTIVFGQFAARFNNFVSGRSENSITPEEFRSDANSFTLWFIYLFVGRLILSYVANLGASIAALRTTSAMRQQLLASTLRQEIGYFEKVGLGSIASQMTTNGNQINQGIADKMIQVVQGLSMFFSAFIVALVVQWKLALITMSIVPAIVLVTVLGISIEAQQESRVQKIHSTAAVLAQEVLSSIKTVHSLWAQDKIIAQYAAYLSAAHTAGSKKSLTYGICYSVEFFCVLSGTALAFWQGYRMFRSGEIQDVGPVLTVILSVTLGATALSFLTPHLQAIATATSAAAELFAVIDRQSALDPLSEEGERPECVGAIEFRNVVFSYPSRPNVAVLRDLSLRVPAGKMTALVGASGCGKSTIMGLLERWYTPDSGQILLDGEDVGRCNIGWLRSHVRLVQQEPVLFRGSIFENIARGFMGEQTSMSKEQQMRLVRKACEDSFAAEFIERLPQGYHTQVGEGASLLSGGQKQRLAIARSIVSEPRILLLDEATSALDSKSEAMVQKALNHVCKGRTTLAIAHNLATIQAAEQIVVMSYGRVVESGSHAELLALDGQYAAMLRAQRLHGAKQQQQQDETPTRSEQVREGAGGAAVHPETRSLSSSSSSSSGAMADAGAAEGGAGASRRVHGVDEEEESIGASLLRCVWMVGAECSDLGGWFAGMAAASVVAGGTYPAQAVLFSRLVGVFVRGDGEEERSSDADLFALIFFIVALANLAAYFLLGWAANAVGQAVGRRYRQQMFAALVRMDVAFFSHRASGSLAARLTSAPAALQELIAGSAALVLIVLVNVAATSILAIAVGWKLGLVLVGAGLPLLVGAGLLRSRLESTLDTAVTHLLADGAALATEAVTAIRTVAALHIEPQLCREYAHTLAAVRAVSLRTFAVIMLPFALSQALEFLVMALGFWYGSRLISTGEYTASQFFIIFIAIVLGGQAAAQFFGHTASMAKAQNAINYIFWLRAQQPVVHEDSTNAAIGPSGGDDSLVLDNVAFAYPRTSARRVLNGINMNILPGSYVACVGSSGCGKSTLISLLERYYDPDAGSIRLGNRNIAEMSPRLYRQHVSLVPQEPTLYQGSVRDNLSLGLPGEPSEEQMREACRIAHVLDFVSSLPEGLDTPCGSKGTQFSGGQRQRIAIARALIRHPHILLLDEATSSLDSQSEKLVQDALGEASAGRTTFAVAHRLSTIKHASTIFVLEHGEIVEQGTHEQLLQLAGRYYDMCRAQQLSDMQ